MGIEISRKLPSKTRASQCKWTLIFDEAVYERFCKSSTTAHANFENVILKQKHWFSSDVSLAPFDDSVNPGDVKIVRAGGKPMNRINIRILNELDEWTAWLSFIFAIRSDGNN